jgi:pyruvate kinase
MTITERMSAGYWAELFKTAYFTPGVRLVRERADEVPSECVVGALPSTPRRWLIHRGDTIVLVPAQARPTALQSALADVPGKWIVPCTLPAVFADLHAGERVLFDDGKIGGVVRYASFGEVHVEITQARVDGEKLGSDKGINFPDSELRLPALTQCDLSVLSDVARYVDMIGLSFVHDPADVFLLQQRLAELSAQRIGVVLKIETRRAFERLPQLILAAMRSEAVGLMIARGDLAVECGFERMAEIQEEILWICEAAHVPVIWATQVLEKLAKEGLPSRAEITDAAMSVRAECAMLNKGPHILEAIRALDDILRRMQEHQSKKRSLLRPLRVAKTVGAYST